MAGTVRVYVKKQLRLDRLNVRQQSMFKIGNVGVAEVKNRLAAAQGPNDGAAKPLSKYYAIRKTKMGKGNRRNLYLTGDMLRELSVRTVGDNKSKAALTTRKNKLKGWITAKIEPWCMFSPKNREAIRKASEKVLAEIAPRLPIERWLGGKQ